MRTFATTLLCSLIAIVALDARPARASDVVQVTKHSYDSLVSTGVVVAPEWVLTTGLHVDPLPADLKVDGIPVVCVVFPDGYAPAGAGNCLTPAGNLALLKLIAPTSSPVQPLASGHNSFSGEIGRTVWWEGAESLRSAFIPIIPNDMLAVRMTPIPGACVDSEHIGVFDPSQAAPSAQSGALFVGPTVVGIASWWVTSGGMPDTSYPYVYTRVSEHADWIQETIASDITGPCGQLFTGLVAELVDPDAEGWTELGYPGCELDTYRVYATFEGNEGNVTAVGDEYGFFEVTSSDGTFWNSIDNSSGDGNLPPFDEDVEDYPEVLWDTFVTIGEERAPEGASRTETDTVPSFDDDAAGMVGDFILNDKGWYIAGFPDVAEVAYGRVLVTQFTVTEGVRIIGTNWRVYGAAPTIYDHFDAYASFDTHASAPCSADLVEDGYVGMADLVTLLSRWGSCDCCFADLDGSGDVGFPDLASLLGAWGACQ